MAGYTLMEMLVGILLVSMLFTYALPGWQSALHAARRVDAMLSLQHLGTLQSRHRAEFMRYATLEELGLLTSQDGHYQLQLEDDLSGYLASARAREDGSQADDHRCRIFTLDAAGRRLARDASGADNTAYCWRSSRP